MNPFILSLAPLTGDRGFMPMLIILIVAVALAGLPFFANRKKEEEKSKKKDDFNKKN